MNATHAAATATFIGQLQAQGFAHGRWSRPGSEKLDRSIIVNGKATSSLRVAFGGDEISVIAFRGEASNGLVMWSAAFTESTPFAVIAGTINAFFAA